MSAEELADRLGRLEDANFYGFIWKGSDLQLSLDGFDFSTLLCHWTYDLVVTLSWEDNLHKRGGPLLTMTGQLEFNSENELKLTLDFGNESFVSLRCKDITIID